MLISTPLNLTFGTPCQRKKPSNQDLKNGADLRMNGMRDLIFHPFKPLKSPKPHFLNFIFFLIRVRPNR